MKNVFLFMLYGLFVLILESTWFAPGAAPLHFNLLLPAVVYFSFAGPFSSSLFLVLFFGLLTDLVSTVPLGVFLWTYVLLFLLVRFFLARLISSSPLVRFVWLLIFSIFERVGVMILTPLLSDLRISFPGVFTFLVQTLLDGMFGMLLFPFFFWLRWENIARLFQPKDFLLRKP